MMNVPAPSLFALDLEGILLPEVWIAVADKTGIEQLRLTTRDIRDYDQLMQMRLSILSERGLSLDDIQSVIATMDPLPGATDFLRWLRAKSQVVIITDSFYQFVAPFLPKLDYPTVFAHSLEIDEDGMIIGYRLRVPEGKRLALQSFRALGFRTMAVGDSHNDIGMLDEADQGVLYRPPPNVVEQYPQFPTTFDYASLKAIAQAFL